MSCDITSEPPVGIEPTIFSFWSLVSERYPERPSGGSRAPIHAQQASRDVPCRPHGHVLFQFIYRSNHRTRPGVLSREPVRLLHDSTHRTLGTVATGQGEHHRVPRSVGTGVAHDSL